MKVLRVNVINCKQPEKTWLVLKNMHMTCRRSSMICTRPQWRRWSHVTCYIANLSIKRSCVISHDPQQQRAIVSLQHANVEMRDLELQQTSIDSQLISAQSNAGKSIAFVRFLASTEMPICGDLYRRKQALVRFLWSASGVAAPDKRIRDKQIQRIAAGHRWTWWRNRRCGQEKRVHSCALSRCRDMYVKLILVA